MRKHTILAVATAFMLATSLAPIVSAQGSTRTEEATYFVGGDVVILCNPLGLPINIGGVCFDLKDNEHEIDIFVQDHGQTETRRLDGEVDETLEEAGSPVTNVADFGFTSGFYEILDEDGNVLSSDIFCGSANDVQLHDDADRVEVFLDGAAFGNPLLTACGTTFSGATTGHVFLRAEDP